VRVFGERAHGLALALEPLAGGPVEVRCGQDLDGDGAPEGRLVGPVHRREPAHTDLLGLLQAVDAEIDRLVVRHGFVLRTRVIVDSGGPHAGTGAPAGDSRWSHQVAGIGLSGRGTWWSTGARLTSWRHGRAGADLGTTFTGPPAATGSHTTLPGVW
jgi:hypothetical protein